jgi:hypothetical protein
MPEGFRYIKSWEVEELLCNNYNIFKDLEKPVYYKIINSHNLYRWLGLRRRGDDSFIDGVNRNLNGSYGVRGVLVCKK